MNNEAYGFEIGTALNIHYIHYTLSNGAALIIH